MSDTLEAPPAPATEPGVTIVEALDEFVDGVLAGGSTWPAAEVRDAVLQRVVRWRVEHAEAGDS